MDDLNGLQWSSQPNSGQTKANYQSSAFNTLKPTPPASGRASPYPQSNSPAPPTKTVPPASDSFSNLVSFSSSSANKNLSLQDQQKRLAELKLQQLGGYKQTADNQWGGSDDVWNNLGSGRSTPAIQNVKDRGTSPAQLAEEDDDLFVAFNGPVKKQAPSTEKPAAHPIGLDEDDDDPFGLAEFQAKHRAAPPAPPSTSQLGDDDDDILGDLAKPAVARPPSQKSPDPTPAPSSDHPQDKAVAELVDMGFSAEKARRALEGTETGLDVQAAVGLLLNEAHAASHQKAKSRSQNRNDSMEEENRPTSRTGRSRPSGEQSNSVPSGADRSSTPSNDPAKAASDFGSAFIKTAGSFWKQAQKQVQQAVQEFNSDSESSQPKWMREASGSRSQHAEHVPGEAKRGGRGQSASTKQEADVTDEAMMLESQRPTPPPRQMQRSRPDRMFDSSADNSRDHSPAMPSRLRESHSPQPAFLQSQNQPGVNARPQAQAAPSSRSMLSRNAADEQASQAYVSSARRRKAPAAPSTSEADLMEGSTKPTSDSATAPVSPVRKPPLVKSTPVTVRPPAPKRDIPPINSIALKASHAARLEGNAHFKRGDYASAHVSYGTSLTHLPKTHPLTIVLLTNHALTALKTGEPKTALTDSDAALLIIGTSKGEAETVDFANGEPAKPMRDYYGKALMRKAEALEQMEKWSDAASVWRLCVEDGHGGSQAMQGRMRAEKAAQPKAAPRPAAAVKKPPAKTPARPAMVNHSKSSEAVTRLRAANAASERADDEKFALSDSVDARINAWRGGKADNLRALLASLDTVLWLEAKEGWKKISMADLVLPGKVKISYMKGIAKVHPDKISTEATTEQRMIAGAVFSTLNEAWDKFKTENGL